MLKLLFIILTFVVSPEKPSITELLYAGDFELAEVLILEQLEQQPSDYDLIELQTLYGDIWFYRGKFDLALENYFQALIVAEGIGDRALQAAQMKNIAIAYSELKHYGNALNWHEQAKITLNHDLNSNTGMSILLSQAMIFNHIGAPELAMETLAQAQNVTHIISNHAGLNNSYLRLASFFLKNNAYSEAKTRLDKVELDSFNDMSDTLWYYQLRLVVELSIGDLINAEKQLEQFNQLTASGSYQNDSLIKISTVHLYLLQGKLSDAKGLIDDLNLSQEVDLWQTMYLRALWFKVQNKHLQAFDMYKNAVELFQEQYIKELYDEAYIQIPVSLLQETIVAASDIGFDDMSQLFDWINWLYLAKHPKFSNVAKTESKYGRTINAEIIGQGFSEVMDDVMQGQFGIKHNNQLNLPALQHSLKSDEGFLFYLSVNKQLMAFMVGNDRVELIELHHDIMALNDQISRFLNMLSTNDDWLPLSQQIEKQIVRPLRDYGLDDYKKLFIVLDENLRFLPFDVLLDEQGEMMLDKHNISLQTIHSLSQFIADRNSVDYSITPQDKPQIDRLSFVGTMSTMTSVPSYWRTAYRNLDFQNQPFKGIEKEHALIKSLGLAGNILLNELATETSTIKIIENETGILHLASHGFDNPVAPAFSSLVLTGNEYDDGLLQAREVSKLSSHLSLVVLASCSSAKGGLQGRYGYQLGLAEAFLQAGAKSVVGTLWDVKDQKTQQFMQWFYQFLKQVRQPELALKLAKNQAIKNQWQAKDWSGFVVLGDGTIDINLGAHRGLNGISNGFWFYTVLLAIAVLVTVVLIQVVLPERKRIK